MLKHPALAAFGASLLALPLQALPYGENWHDRHHSNHRPENQLIEKYDRFAGSDRNARELVEGLRNDSEIELSSGGRTTKFKPATDNLGYGNVDLALGLAKASLAEHGIHKPTPEQIKAALNGGTVTTKSGQRVTLPGVLKLRASGMGWGQVAHKLGVKVGDVKGHGRARGEHDDDKHHHKHARHHRDDDDDRHHHRKHVKHEHKHDNHDSKHEWRHDRKHHDRNHGDRHDHRNHAHYKPEHKPDWKHHGKPDVKHHHHRPEFQRAKFERPERVHRPEKIERPHRPERPERPERHHHRH
ncbi:MAG TPA: hypothetical protein VJ797_04665 [Burkholderiales bacterium]|nr:hypothetical protein [Burkholderiales bacterium]